MTNAILLSLAVLTLVQTVQGTPQPQQSCGADRTLTADQKARRTEGVRLARRIHALQVSQPGAQQNKYLSQQDLALQVPAGLEVKLDLTATGYWFMVMDRTDGWAFVSNQSGIIFEAEPIR